MNASRASIPVLVAKESPLFSDGLDYIGDSVIQSCHGPAGEMEAQLMLLRSGSCLLLIFALLFGADYVGTAEAAQVGKVTRVQKQAQVGSRPAKVGTPINMSDRIRTGAGARLQVTFVDGTNLTLGENASVVVDKFVYNPAKSVGAMALSSSRGAVRFTTGKIGNMKKKDVTVSTPSAALAVRGTEFWMGPIDGHYGAYVLKGQTDVTSRGRTVRLKPGYGTDIRRRR